MKKQLILLLALASSISSISFIHCAERTKNIKTLAIERADYTPVRADYTPVIETEIEYYPTKPGLLKRFLGVLDKIIWGKQPLINDINPSAPRKLTWIKHAQQVDTARNYQVQRTALLTTLASALSFGIATYTGSTSRATVTLAASALTGASAWLLLYKRAHCDKLQKQCTELVTSCIRGCEGTQDLGYAVCPIAKSNESELGFWGKRAIREMTKKVNAAIAALPVNK